MDTIRAQMSTRSSTNAGPWLQMEAANCNKPLRTYKALVCCAFQFTCSAEYLFFFPPCYIWATTLPTLWEEKHIFEKEYHLQTGFHCQQLYVFASPLIQFFACVCYFIAAIKEFHLLAAPISCEICHQLEVPSDKYTKNYGKSPFYSWENPLFLWPCSIAFCMFTRSGTQIPSIWLPSLSLGSDFTHPIYPTW